MAEASGPKLTWGLFLGLSALFAVGNMVFANLFFQLVGFPGFVMGIVVSGTMTIFVALFLVRRKAGPHPDSEQAG